MIFQAGNVRESASLFNLKEKNYMKDSKIQTHDLDGLVCCANHQTTEDLLEWKENNLSTYCINPNPQKRT